jgi:hypothetical protein
MVFEFFATFVNYFSQTLNYRQLSLFIVVIAPGVSDESYNSSLM